MKKISLLSVLFLAFSINAQVSIQWEALPAQLAGSAEVLAQSKQGTLFAFGAAAGRIFSKKPTDNNWQAVNFDSPPYHYDAYNDRFPQDDAGNIYYFDDEKIYQFEEQSNSFKQILAGKLDYIADVAFGNDKIYVLEYNQLKVFDAKNYALLNSKKIATDGFLSLMIGKNGKNYAVSRAGFTDFYLSTFSSDGTNFKEKSATLPKGYRHRTYLLASNNILSFQYDKPVLSADDGLTWKPMNHPLDPNMTKFYHSVNANNELSFVTSEKIHYTKDEGKTWLNINLPQATTTGEYALFLSENNIIVGQLNCERKITYHTKNKGAIWTEIPSAPAPVSQEFTLNKDKDLFSKSCEYFDEVKTANATAWKSLSINANSKIERVMTLKSGKWLVYNSTDQTYYASADKGKNWGKQQRFPNGVTSPVIYQNQLNELVIFDTNKYYLSNDDGLVWQEIIAQGLDFQDVECRKLVMIDKHIFTEVSIKNENYILHYDETTKQTTYLSEKNNSTIQGVVANTLHLLNNNKLCFVAPFSNGSSVQMQFYISHDFGKTYTLQSIPIKFNACNLTFNDNNTLILSAESSIYISYDLGESWLEVVGNLPVRKLKTVAVDQDDYLYVAVKGLPIFKSKHTIENFKKIRISVFADFNKNNKKEPNELIVPGIKLKNNIGKGEIKTTNNQGFSESFAFGGTYTVTPLADSDIFEPNTNIYTVSVDKTTDVALLEIPMQVDSCAKLKISFTMPTIRRCFENTINFQIYNEGVFDAIDSKITINLDTFMIFKNTKPSNIKVISNIGRKLVLDIGQIKGRDYAYFTVDYLLDCKATLGQKHCVDALAEARNECSDDNRATKVYSECQVNIGSYDPNDKAAFVDGRKNATQVKAKQTLEYLIRFQNTGTDTAFNIVIKDPISRNLDIESIEPGIASHRYTWETKGDELYFHFNNIMLPDSNISEKNSHGFIKFSIKPKPNITIADIISNTAGIYFDFNDPVLTNDVILNQKITKNKDFSNNSVSFNLYPNPVRDVLHISILDEKLLHVAVYSMEGRLMLSQKSDTNNIFVEQLPAGIYLLQIQTEKGIGTGRFLKE